MSNIYDFFDALKSRPEAMLRDYESQDMSAAELVVNWYSGKQRRSDALSFIVHGYSSIAERGRKMCEKLKDESPRQLLRFRSSSCRKQKITPESAEPCVKDTSKANVCFMVIFPCKKKLLRNRRTRNVCVRWWQWEIPQKAFMSVQNWMINKVWNGNFIWQFRCPHNCEGKLNKVICE